MCRLCLQVTLSRGSDGETLSTLSMKLDPVEVCFAEKKEEPGQAKQDSCTISVNVGKRNLYLITVSGNMTRSHKAIYTALQFERTQVTASKQGTATDGGSSPCCSNLRLSATFACTCLHRPAYRHDHVVKLLIVMSPCRLHTDPHGEHHQRLLLSTLEAQHSDALASSGSFLNNQSDTHVCCLPAARCQGPATGAAFGAVFPGPVWGH